MGERQRSIKMAGNVTTARRAKERHRPAAYGLRFILKTSINGKHHTIKSYSDDDSSNNRHSRIRPSCDSSIRDCFSGQPQPASTRVDPGNVKIQRFESLRASIATTRWRPLFMQDGHRGNKADGEGFEPPVRFPVRRFSKPVPSTRLSHPSYCF